MIDPASDAIVRFLVFGAGALGSLVAARLATAHDVCLVARSEHASVIRERGLRVRGRTDLVQRSIVAVDGLDDLGDEAPDAVLVTVKSYDTETAVADLARYHATSTFVSLQNGLGNEATIAAGADRVLGAVINQGVTFVRPGEVLHAGEGETTIGPYAGTTRGDADNVAAAFRAGGLAARAVDDIEPVLWTKAILNAAVNPLTALLRIETGALLASDALSGAIEMIVDESLRIASASDIELDRVEVLATIQAVIRATRDNRSSMLQDLERGRRTEIEAINGALVARARATGTPCPVNELLRRLVVAAS